MLLLSVVLMPYFFENVKVVFANLQVIVGLGFPEAVQLNVAVFRYSTSCLDSGEMVTLGATKN